MDKQRIHPIKTVLSMKLSKAVNILYADTIQKKTLDLLNYPNAITLSPTLAENEDGKTYLVAGKSSKETYNVSVLGNGSVKCNCRGFKFTKVRSHSVAVSEKEGMLRNYVVKVKGSHSRSAATYPLNAKGSGRKGGQKRRQRLYHPEKPFQGRDEENASKNPFTQIWHNNNPLAICSAKSVPLNKNSCEYCGTELPRGPLAIVAFDIVISHKERWQYLNRRRESEQDPKYLPSPANSPTTRYYCIRRNCIYNRFPYFNATFLEVDVSIILTNSHKKIINEQLNVSL